jgi:hypothetical protein
MSTLQEIVDQLEYALQRAEAATMTGDGNKAYIDGYAILATHTEMAVCYLRDLRALEPGA